MRILQQFIIKGGSDRILLTGGKGKERPSELKVSVGFDAGFIGEGEITYAGENAYGRAELAGSIIKERISEKPLRNLKLIT